MRTRSASPSAAVWMSLALCAAAAGAVAAPASIAGGEGRLTVTAKTATGQRGRWLVEFQGEISQPTASGGNVVRSLKGAAEVDCGAAQFKIAKFNLFAGPDFTGALLLDVGKAADWRSPHRGTAMDLVLTAACGRTQAPARGRAAGAPAKRPASVPAVQAVQASAPVVVPTAAGGGFYAQLASLPSAEAARRAWDELKGAAPWALDDRELRLTTAIVHGRRVWRVSAGGFATKAQAQAVCKALGGLSARCFVRAGDAS